MALIQRRSLSMGRFYAGKITGALERQSNPGEIGSLHKSRLKNRALHKFGKMTDNSRAGILVTNHLERWRRLGTSGDGQIDH